jgi:pimeloyl-ACP methyl ester carboxylesterase
MSILQISGSRVEYLELGSGEPVVLLHSSGSSGAQWRALAERLGERYRVIAPDLYGYGGTAHWPGRRPFHLECEAEIVLALLGRVNERAHLVDTPTAAPSRCMSQICAASCCAASR